MHYDIFNGDADGICALIQLRQAEPKAAQLVTGVKRDIQLVQKISAQAGDCITVLDISLAQNINAIRAQLGNGASVFYIDHHQTGRVPTHSKFTALLNTNPDICTSLLADQWLGGTSRAWAVVGAFGDNLCDSAVAAAKMLSLSTPQLEQLKQLGTYINYNAYGNTLSDLHVAPGQLYQQLLPYSSPLDFIHDCQPLFQQLHAAYTEDLTLANNVAPAYANDRVYIVLLPDEAWARRVSGVFGNLLANQYPQRAHAILTTISTQAYQVSVRAPLVHKHGAEVFCTQFPSGGGRAAAAGINALPKSQLEKFVRAMQVFSWR